MKQIKSNFQKLINFIVKDIWLISVKEVSLTHGFLIRSARAMVLSFRGFQRDKCVLRASALTYFTLLSVVPLVAMLFGIAKGFGLQELLEKELMERFAENQQVMRYIVNFSNSLLSNTKGSFIAGPGFVILIWAVLRLLGNIEQDFNDIWYIKKSRSYVRKISDYLTILLITPLLIVLSNALSIYVFTQITEIAESLKLLGIVGPVIQFLLRLSPVAVMWILLAFVYIVIPNGKVHFHAGFLAAVLSGTLLKIFQWIFITFQVGAAKYNAIYGSFAALPLFLVWMQTSWTIVLYGAELSFAIQNTETYRFDESGEALSQFNKYLLALLICSKIIRRFTTAQPPVSDQELSVETGAPVRLILQQLYDLKQAGIISEILREDIEEPAYQPAVDPGKLTVAYVVNALKQIGSGRLPVEPSADLQKLENSLRAFQGSIEKTDENFLLQEI
ncbi:MAG: YihY/virulence factor BrkB family protein [Candidatus Marinimicrobia bacterium]|nr:YihY/virulence factor BrkB family protein [Candidatus Neomarinimicrobiota bacterium]